MKKALMFTGLAAAGVATYFLMDKKNMRKAQKVIDDMLDEAESLMKMN